jgi:Xaa-Pro dipeptidase
MQNPEISKHIDYQALDKYWKVGGVRIEDNVRILKDGSENLTTAPKSLEEIHRLASA